MKHDKLLVVKSWGEYLFFSLICICLTACDEESDNRQIQDLIIPPSAYSFLISSTNIEDEETIIYAVPSFTENFEILGCEVKKVVYYIDEVLASTETTSPFKLEYSTSTIATGTHVLKAVITVGGEYFKETSVEYKKEFSVNKSSPATQSAVTFDFKYDHYVRVGDNIHVSCTMKDRYDAGYRINSVKYYFDGKLINNVEKEPFEMDYSPMLEVGKSYSLKAEVVYSIGTTQSSYSYSSTITVLADDETRFMYVQNYPYGAQFSNGDVISGKGLLYKGKGDDMIYELNLYWDDVLVGTSREFPYDFEYTISNATKGIHQLKYEWKTYEKNGDYQNSQSQFDTITIVK